MLNRTSNISVRELGKAGSSLVTYDDLLISVSAAKLPAANAPTWTDITLDGFTSKILAFTIGDYIDFFVQTNHSVKLNTALEQHIHWTLWTDEVGDEIAFELTGVGAGIGTDFASIGTITTPDHVLDGTEALKHNYLNIGDVPAINTTVSSVYILRLKRVAVADGTDASGTVGVVFTDLHTMNNTFGSLEEASKS